MKQIIKDAKKDLLENLTYKKSLSKFCLDNYCFDNAVKCGEKLNFMYDELKKHKGELLLYNGFCGAIKSPYLSINREGNSICLNIDESKPRAYSSKYDDGTIFWNKPKGWGDKGAFFYPWLGYSELEKQRINPKKLESYESNYKVFLIGNENVARAINPEKSNLENIEEYKSFIESLYGKRHLNRKLEKIKNTDKSDFVKAEREGTLAELILF